MEGASLGQATAVPLGIQLKQEHGQARTRAVVGSDGVVDEYTISVSCVLEVGSGLKSCSGPVESVLFDRGEELSICLQSQRYGCQRIGSYKRSKGGRVVPDSTILALMRGDIGLILILVL